MRLTMPTPAPDPGKVRLLHGPYTAPAVKRGDRVNDLARDCEVIVTTWTDVPISWPRAKRAGRGAPSLLVDEELARAVRTESAAAVMYWWRVSVKVVWKWRIALGVDKV